MNIIFDCCGLLLLYSIIVVTDNVWCTRWQPVTLKVCIAAVAFLTSGLASLCVASFLSPVGPVGLFAEKKEERRCVKCLYFCPKLRKIRKNHATFLSANENCFKDGIYFFHVANKKKYKTKWSQIRVTKRPPYHSGWLWGSGGGSLSSLRPVVERFWVQTRKLLT